MPPDGTRRRCCRVPQNQLTIRMLARRRHNAALIGGLGIRRPLELSFTSLPNQEIASVHAARFTVNGCDSADERLVLGRR